MNSYGLSAKDLITKTRIQLLLGKDYKSLNEKQKYWPFLGTLAINLQIKDGTSIGCKTWGTDGRFLYYNPEFTESLSPEERLGVMAHELGHLIYQHVLEWRRPSTKEFPEIFTMAQEFVVNDMVVNMFGLRLPGKPFDVKTIERGSTEKGYYYDPAFSGMYTEQVYYELLKRLKPQKLSFEVAEGMVDQHGLGAPGEGQQGEGQPDGEQGRDASGWGSEQDIEKLSKEIKLKVAQAATTARMRGILPAGMECILGELLEPKIPWRQVLAEFLCGTAHDDYSWKVPNRRHLYRGVVLPALRSESIEIALIFDTSGSISTEDLTEAYSEARGIMNAFGSYTLHLMGCDAAVQSYQIAGPHDEPDLKELFKGRGGTSFAPPIQKLQKENVNPRAVVYFTADACGDFPEEPDFPVLWVVKEGAMEVPFGRTVRLD